MSRKNKSEKAEKLLVLDIDNTVFDWVSYYAASLGALFETVAPLVHSTPEVLAREAKTVFAKHNSIEHPFLVQELDSVCDFYKDDIPRMLSEAVELGRQAFNSEAQAHLIPYDGVIETLKNIQNKYPNMAIAALTDAPRYVAMWKLNKLGLLSFFDAVYGLPDPKLPTDESQKHVKVDQEILIKHLQKVDFGFDGLIRTLPDDYEKPGKRGLKTVFMDFDMEDQLDQILWVGDNLRKDVGLGKAMQIHTAWAKYGTNLAPEVKEQLLTFSPEANIHKNVPLDPHNENSPKPDFVLDKFSDIEAGMQQIWP